ncbi:hypothetical protein G7075_14660 [Phycicoccus sp. HDW14]|uniref:hypothetical protein n=1 Tax=Phycicoccus sp. HDW14 TaxID=2714941 RepID=UPI00140C8D2A|nr:hypothetical protein [Phycicoccus sp. HDW14]QIM22083.1 hypothetical protein G7075_14660 [Phycicoccus sp. HDW14]
MVDPPPSVPARRPSAPPARRVPMVFDAPRHGATPDSRITTARRWAAGGLAVPTLGLLVVVVWFLDAIGGVDPRGLLGVSALVLPGVLVGWCTGFAALALLVRDQLFHPRLVGLVAALVGTVFGALLLPLAGIG